MAKFGLPGGGKRTSQPQQPARIDRSNPLTLGLKAVFTTVGGSLYDHATKALPTSDNGLHKPTPQGVARDYAAGTRAVFGNKVDYGLTGAMTIIVIADVDVLADYGALISCADTPTTNGWELRLGLAATDSRIILHRSNSNYRQFASAGTSIIAAGSKNNFIAVACADGIIETAPAFFNVNGINYTPGASVDGPGTGAATASIDPLYIASREDGVTKLDGAILYVALFARALSFAETESIRKNPWQLFEPIKRNIYVEAAASGVSGTIAATLAGFTSSITGTTTITGSIAQTVASAVSAFTGNTTVTGTIAKTLENDVGNLVGNTGATGTIAVTAQNDTASMSGKTTIVGTMNASTENATSNATGSTTIVGQMAASVSNFIAAMTDAVGGIVARLLSLLGVGS